jgi:6-phosphogluconolactonase
MQPAVEIFNDADELAQQAAQLILTQSQLAVARNNFFTIALSGGSTPKRLYELLADPTQQFRSNLPWDRIHFFWTDERHVPPDDPDSNYRMVSEAMLARAPVPPINIHRMLSEKANASEAADDYELRLRKFFHPSTGELPRIDFVLLGLGTDGHTASLFPDSEVLQETQRWVAAPWIAKLNSNRLTMTLPVLNNASTVVFLVSGREKAEILREVLKGEPDRFPAQRINPTNGALSWLVDADGASKLPENSKE